MIVSKRYDDYVFRVRRHMFKGAYDHMPIRPHDREQAVFVSVCAVLTFILALFLLYHVVT